MGRRKKEPESAHRANIALAAERLFTHGGIEAATMSDIAKLAGYSKATLYVYFANKDEIVSYLVHNSMKTLCAHISAAVDAPGTVKEKYLRICRALVRYQAQYPLYFTLSLGEINVDAEQENARPLDKETYRVGEQINAKIEALIIEGIQTKALQPHLPVLQTAFLFWASLSGLIQLAVNKQAYLEQAVKVTKQQFLEDGFQQLYQLIAAGEKK